MRITMATWLSNRGLVRKLGLGVLAFLVTFGLPLTGRAVTPPSVTLTPSVASPQMLGTPVTWTARVLNAVAGHTYDYQFSVTYNGQTQIVSDFALPTNFTWVPHTVEGAYTFNVVVRDITATPYILFAPVSVTFTLMPWVTTPLATGAVNPTSHPLIALFSGPPCRAGHQLLVRFLPASPTGTQNPNSMTTNLVPCSKNSVNFYVGGHVSDDRISDALGGVRRDDPGEHGQQFAVHYRSASRHFPTTYTSTCRLSRTTRPIQWCCLNQLPRPDRDRPPRECDLVFPQHHLTMARSDRARRELLWISLAICRIYDLAGNLVTRTNVEILNEQLAAKGYPTMVRLNTHEFRNLPDGNMACLAYRYVVSTSAQGGTPTNPVNIVGDMVLVLDHNLQLVWAWDSFAHEDINRAATDGDFVRSRMPTAVGPDWCTRMPFRVRPTAISFSPNAARIGSLRSITTRARATAV